VPVQGCTLPLTPSSTVVKKEYSYTSTPPMGRTACTESQSLYNGALYLYWLFRKECLLVNAAETERNEGSERNPVNCWGRVHNTLCRPAEAELPHPREGAGLVLLRHIGKKWAKEDKDVASVIFVFFFYFRCRTAG